MLEINNDNFQKEVLDNKIPVLVDAYAIWCGPCRMIAPILEKLQQDYEGKIKIVKIDIDANPSFSERFKIQSIPNLVFFKGGVEIDRIIGAASVAAFKEKIDKVIA